MSKGKGTKGDKISLKTKELIESSKNKTYENSIEIGKLIWAKFPDERMEMAKIIECKPVSGYNEIKKKNEYSYDYYVHYINHNRRMDRYVPRKDIEYVIMYLIYYRMLRLLMS